MAIKPFFTMARKEVEAIIARVPPPEQERIHNILKHSRSMYDFDGKHIPHEFENENLLDVISQRDVYVVDSNSDWRRECKEHPDKAFIITPALSRENPNTKELILEASRCKLGNLFSIGIATNINCFLVERIDEYFIYDFDREKLEEASKGKGPVVAKQKAQIWDKINFEKKLIRGHICLAVSFLTPLESGINFGFLDSGKASDLPSPDKIEKAITLLKGDILRRLPNCKHNVGESKLVVEECYATLLIEDTEPKGIRFEFDEPNYEHVFGDMYIVQAAIYLEAKIMTKDKKLTKMASYANIKCCHVPMATSRA